MKKILFAATAFFIFGFSIAVAAHAPKAVPTETPDSDSTFYLGLGTGINLPVQNWNPNFELGGGGDFFAGFPLDRQWAVQFDVDQWFFNGAGFSIYDLRLMPTLRWKAPGGKLHPYFLAGLGYDLQFAATTGAASSAPGLTAGAGLQWDLAPREHLFLETKLNFLFYDGTTLEDFPILAGLSLDL
jgi:hypothetical protein